MRELRDFKVQNAAERAIEIAAADGHDLPIQHCVLSTDAGQWPIVAVATLVAPFGAPIVTEVLRDARSLFRRPSKDERAVSKVSIDPRTAYWLRAPAAPPIRALLELPMPRIEFTTDAPPP